MKRKPKNTLAILFKVTSKKIQEIKLILLFCHGPGAIRASDVNILVLLHALQLVRDGSFENGILASTIFKLTLNPRRIDAAVT